ncbi:cytochrome c biogenesis protein [Natronobacterium gregoryi]|uniref:ABC transporter permease n=2 Tax=Natronobacterium gregoryi TaxID=44930 RepID=L0AM59_NATGS|nr:cytochrome c biogenesis protein CcsA [Natronobacterium gregoryi]AFZ74267.1 ABC-type transport system involved in cytochrome c biogenesis, permease component [Natronobacterium gregoryi SP2]ELY63725.1 ABC-type transport system permease protein 2 (heme exporter protein C) [Natronobacterium gregoryi SP2]PLK21950.1 ABC transporter permease [Natronobacterium gregoryi SP2]SFI52665.1 heme exporter protein C [Natronobacterium gregoryi]
MGSYEGRTIGFLRWVFRSSVPGYLTLILGLASIGLVFGHASKSMYGVSHGINLIAYWHVPLALVGGLALTVTFAGCVLYLVTGTRFWEQLAHGSAELGFVFATLTLVTGSAWGRVIWNTWWDWSDIRLVTFLFVWFIYAGYLIIYSSGDRGGRVSRLASVYGVVGFITVPISYASTRLWTARLHAPSMGNPDAEAAITASVLFVSLFAVLFLYVSLLGVRVHLHELTTRIDSLKNRTRTETYKRTERQ